MHHQFNPRLKKFNVRQPDRLINFFDKFMVVIAIIGPMTTMPQIIDVWTTKNVSGLSELSWLGYSVIAIVWIFYGYIHKEKIVIAANIMWLIVHSAVLIGILIYK